MNLEPWLIAGISALIGAIATLYAPVVAEKLRARTEMNVRTQTKMIAPIDIRGVWSSNFGEETDRIHIEDQTDRRISGVRYFRGFDRIERRYLVVGFFDGMLLTIAATGADPTETRTLGMVMRRVSGTRFEGVRSYAGDQKIATTSLRQWNKN